MNDISPDICKDFAFSVLASNLAAKKRIKNSRDIVIIWKEIREQFKIENNIDLISLFLTSGRITDLSINVDCPRDVAAIYASIHEKVEKEIPAKELDMKSIASAYLSSRYVSATKKIETIKEMVEIMKSFDSIIEINSRDDFIAAILVSSRILDQEHLISPSEIMLLIKRVSEQMALE